MLINCILKLHNLLASGSDPPTSKIKKVMPLTWPRPTLGHAPHWTTLLTGPHPSLDHTNHFTTSLTGPRPSLDHTPHLATLLTGPYPSLDHTPHSGRYNHSLDSYY